MSPSEDILVVPRYLSVLEHDGSILVGALPPRAVEVEEAPAYLAGLIAYLSTPRSRAEAIERAMREGGIDTEEAELLVDELLGAGILARYDIDEGSRYARHLLYYDLLGVEAEAAQEALSKSTVGLIGTGGIGTNLAMTLVAAGVGNVVFSDGDKVELSNLTRQTLFDESAVGRPKVEVAAERLRALNADVSLRPVPSSFYGVEMLDEHFADCDVVVLSADSPAEIHTWINDASLRHGFAYSNAGYIEAFGVVGPMVVPRESPCYECIRADADLRNPAGSAPRNLNSRHQAPSYGPLNSLVASIQANEVIRKLLGQPVQTVGQRLLLDATTYEVHREDYAVDPSCPACGNPAAMPKADASLAEVYGSERESASQNSLVLDELVAELLPGAPRRRVLDIGCGSGHEAVRLASEGSQIVALDRDPEMLAITERRAREADVSERIVTTAMELSEIDGHFDDVLCLNVLDHIEDVRETLSEIVRLAAPDATVLISVPHPIKDRGAWRKERRGDRWHYPEFVLLESYFDEGPVSKSRENAKGETVIESITTFHRTTETWVRLFLEAGFTITDLREPVADPSRAEGLPVLYEKSSRIPYFQLFVLKA